MNDSNSRGWLHRLLSPSPRRSVLTLVVIGIILGVGGVIAFDATMHATSTEEFCTSCHEMAENPLAQMKSTPHYSNPQGVAATCSDCHLPHEFVPKMIRKVEAAREVWGHMTGIIDTPEKYAAHAPAMKEREINRLKANDSQECRNCHQVERMVLAEQSRLAQRMHQKLVSGEKTCIDCHQGIAHAGATGE